jgi:hypothetical protein
MYQYLMGCGAAGTRRQGRRPVARTELLIFDGIKKA